MSKTKLIDRLADRMGSRAKAQEAVEAVTGGILEMVRDKEEVVLKGFGTFKRKDRAERQARNPQTGEPIRVGAKTTLGFKTSVTF